MSALVDLELAYYRAESRLRKHETRHCGNGGYTCAECEQFKEGHCREWQHLYNASEQARQAAVEAGVDV